MEKGGYIALINGTKYDWRLLPATTCDPLLATRNPRKVFNRTKIYQHEHQMISWDFPDIVPAGKSTRVKVEWNDDADAWLDTAVSPFETPSEVSYNLGNTGLSFQVQATPRCFLGVKFTNFETPGNPVGSVVNLKWVQDGCVTFILAGEQGKFTSTNLPSESWMHDNLNVLGERSLVHLCIPGSHDSGMSTFGAHTYFAAECNTVTQTRTILGQLQLGARYFDIRPVISGGEYFTGHYSKVGVTWQGANGQSIPSIIKEINDFSATNKELVILYFTHDLNTDEGNASFRPFTQGEWNSLLAMLKGVNNLFVAPNPSTIDLTKQKLSTFIGKSNAAVLILLWPSAKGINLGPYANQGFYLRHYDRFVYDKYADTDNLDQMVEDQLQKLKEQRPNPDARYFLLSWTLTKKNPLCKVSSSILDLANKAEPRMYDSLFDRCSSQSYPNILFIDNFSNSNITALAMAINVCF